MKNHILFFVTNLQTPKQPLKKTPLVVLTSRSGRVIKRKEAPDGDEIELPKAPTSTTKKPGTSPKAGSPLKKKLALDLLGEKLF